ncbi:AsmA family protein [Rhizobium sp. RU20A]|uniref:AsmA family protein n=1 Tax=Rhizobium sp. RU20A TaxID=1907412 RepID=UPI0009561D2C|nr:AsmA-like C-terminal region-containing protein [Rhizobium sp. RU20A]SIQ19815.1 AsmA family protein [Rhizobium sp. RU20A]
MLSRILVTLGGLVVVALFVALIAPYFVDWTTFRREFETQASQIMGKPVVVHGSVDARLLPFPSVTLNDVRVGQGDDGKPLIQVARFSMDAELAPFLSGEALIFDMRIEEPKATLKLQPDGTLDWARGRRAVIPAKAVVLENVEITGGSIDFIDEQTGRTRRITNLEADVSARSLGGPWRVDGRAALDGETGAFSLTSGVPGEAQGVALRARIMPDARPFGVDLDGFIKIVDFRPVYEGDFTLVHGESEPKEDGSNEVPPRLKGKFALTNESVRVPEYRLELGARDDPYLVTGEATLDTGKDQRFLLVADGQQIDVSRIGNAGGEAGKTSRNPTLSMRERLQAVLSIIADIPIPQVPGRASLRLPAIVVGDTTVRDVRLDVVPDGRSWQVENAVALLPGRTQLEAKGRLTLKGERAFRGDLLIASNQPSGLATWLAGSVDPSLRMLKTAGFSAAVNLTDTIQQFEGLEIAVGPATLKGRIERQSPDGQAPSLTLQLKGNRVDIDALRALTGIVAGDNSTDAILAHTIAVDLQADRFAAFGEEARDVQAVLTSKGGQLQIERLSVGDLAGAKLAASGRVSGSLTQPIIGAKMKLAAADLSPFLALVARHVPPHPLFDRVVSGGGYYTDAALDLTLTAGSKDGNAPVTFGVIGTANGTRIAAHYQVPDFLRALAGKSMVLEATLENPTTLTLVGQAGFDPLPFDLPPNGVLSLRLQSDDTGAGSGGMTFTAEGSSFAANGNFSLDRERFLDGEQTVSIDSRDIEPFLLLKGLALPGAGTGLPAKLTAKLVTTGGTVAVNEINGAVDGNTLKGELTFDRTAPRPRVAGRIGLDRAALSWLGETVLGPVESMVDGGLSPTPVAQPFWTGVDVEIDLSAASLDTSVLAPVQAFTGKLLFTGDTVTLDAMAGSLYGGQMSGRISAASGNGTATFTSKLDLAGADLAGLAWKSAGHPVLAGKADLSVALEGAGTSVADMARSLSGSGSAQLGDVIVTGLTSEALAPLLSAADAISGEITAERILPDAERILFSGTSAFKKITVPFSIAAGTLRLQSVSAANAAALFAGDAALNLVDDRLTGELRVTLRAGEQAIAGGDPAVTIAFSGPLATPAATLDVADLSNFLSLRAFERERRRVEILQANVIEKQRLRREVALYKARAQERERIRLRAIEEERRRKAAAERAEAIRAEAEARKQEEARRAAEAEAARKARAEAAEEAARRAASGQQQPEAVPERRTPVTGPDAVIRGGELPSPLPRGQEN